MKVGDRVVCVDDSDSFYPVNGRIVKGEEYTIKYIGNYGTGVILFETKPSHTTYFYIGRFRKIEPHTFKNETTAELAKELTEKLKELDRQPEKELV